MSCKYLWGKKLWPWFEFASLCTLNTSFRPVYLSFPHRLEDFFDNGRTTLKSKKISTSSNASLVPDEVFHEAKGVQLYSSESYQCQPASFPHSHGLTQLSSDVIAERNPVPPSARIICERHQMHMIPVTRVSVNQGKSSFKFFIVGLDKQVYLKDYPARCCWGLCGLGSLCSILWPCIMYP